MIPLYRFPCLFLYSQAEVAAKKIKAVLETNRQNEQLILQYEEMVSNLLEWIRRTVAHLEERPALETVAACQVPSITDVCLPE